MDNLNCTIENPWPGLFSYTENDSQFFFGRETETAKLIQQSINEKLTVLFGESGCGKTSLLQAGLIPRLVEKGYFPIKISKDFYNDWNINQIKNEIIFQINARGYNIDENKDIYIPNTNNETLWEYLHRIMIFDSSYNLLTPIIILDQFEDLFTLANKEIREKWVDQLVWAVNNFKPPHLKDLENDEYWSKIINRNTLNCHFIFVVREDYVGRLDELKNRIPTVMTSRFVLQKFNNQQAKAIISSPFPSVFSDSARDMLIKFLSNNNFENSIEPSILSLTCRELNFQRIRNNDTIIEDYYIAQYGQSILLEFYQKCISKVSSKTSEFIENYLLTKSGYRNLVLYDEIFHFQIPESDIKLLIKDRLLHLEERHNQKWIELSHDKLTIIVQDNIYARQCKQEQKRIKAVQNDTLFAYGRMEDENSWIISEYNESDMGKSSLKTLYFKQEKLKKQGKLTDWLADFPKTSFFELSFKDIEGNPTNSVDGIYTIRLMYNYKKIVSQITYFDKELKPMLHKRGNHGFNFEYDENGNEIKRIIIGIDGFPKRLKEGYAIKKTEYDEDGYPQRVRFYDENELPVSHIDGNHGYLSTYDNLGNEIKRDFIDINNNRMTLKYGYSSVIKKYRKNLCFSQRYLNINDEPCFDYLQNHGVRSDYDDKDRIVKQSSFGINNELVCNNNGYSTFEWTYNDKDQPNSQKYYGIDGNPITDISGVYGVKIYYDDFERIEYIENIDSDNKPICDHDAISLMKIEYDNLSRTSIITNYGINGNSTINIGTLLSFGWIFNYDELGRVIKFTFINSFYNIVKNGDEIAIVKLELDSLNRIVKRSFFDECEQPVMDKDGCYGEVFDYYEYNKAFRYEHDKNGNQIENDIQDIEFNEKNNPTKVTILDKYKKAIILEGNEYSTIVKKYDKYDNAINEFFYDTEGNPVCDNDGTYGSAYVYNVKTNIAITYLGIDGAPSSCKQGFVTKKIEYDENDHISKICFFDENDLPISDIDGNYGIEYKYDSLGNCVYNASLGVDGKIYNNNGLAITTSQYVNSELVKKAYFDCNNQPVFGPEGYHCYEVTRNDKEIVTNYYSTDNKLINIFNKYSTIKQITRHKLFTFNRVIILYYDLSGVMVENENGNFIETYTEDGNLLFIKNKKKEIIGKDYRTFIQKNEVILYPFFLVIYIYYLIKTLVELFIGLFKSKVLVDITDIPIISIAEIVDFKMAYMLGVNVGDLVIEYNNWNYFNYESIDSINSFEIEFNSSEDKSKNILFARKTENSYMLFRIDFPKGFMGLRITDSKINSIMLVQLKENYTKYLKL